MKNPKAAIGCKASTSNSRAARPRTVPGSRTFLVVGIGASAGGLEGFTELLRHLPENDVEAIRPTLEETRRK